MDTVYDNYNQAEAIAMSDIQTVKFRIDEIVESVKNIKIKGSEYEQLIKELNSFLNYSKHYEYFCINDEGHDSSAYLDVRSYEKDFSWWTAAGVPYTLLGNSVIEFAKESLEKI
jgi:hypothetical protein